MIGTHAQGSANRQNILARLAETSVALNSTLPLKTLLAELMATAADIMGAEGASVLLWDERRHDLRFAATTGEGADALLGQPVPLEGSLAGAILREDRALVVEDTQSDPRHYRQTDQTAAFQTRSLIGVPMRSRQRLIGVLEAVNKREPPWTADDVAYLEILAAQAAVAIEGAQLVTALRKANAELARLDEMKSGFIAIASHELRTPLGIILGYSALLQEQEVANADVMLRHIFESAQQMRQIVDDLTLLRLLDQQVQIERVPVHLPEFLSSVQQEARMMVEEAGHRFVAGLIPDTIVIIDSGRIRRALHNLVHNAIRFTPTPGTIRLGAEVHGSEVWIKVSDTGIGIAPDNLERIFDRFKQVEAHMTRQYNGMGIGLSIARGLVTAHEGRLWADSPGLNQGSTFFIALPLSSSSLEVMD